MKNNRFYLLFLCLVIVINGLQAVEVPVVLGPAALPVERLAAQELADKLILLYPGDRFFLAADLPAKGKAILLGQISETRVRDYLSGEALPIDPESYVVSAKNVGGLELGIIAGADAQSVAYGVYGLLERLGCGFTLSGDVVPAVRTKPLSFKDWSLTNKPLIKDRFVFNWHNFLSGCSTWNLANWIQWTDQSQKMGYNAIMVHAYGNNPMKSYTFNGNTKPVGYLSTTVKGRDWSTMHVNDVRRLYGGEVFDSPVFGSEAAQVPDEERMAASRKLMQAVFAHAAERGMNVIFSFDVDTRSANPQALIASLPESARFSTGENGALWLANPDTEDGYRFYKAQVAALLSDYPQITTLAPWFHVAGHPLPNVKLTEMPAAWQSEYQTAIEQRPEIAKFRSPEGMFAVGKIVRAFERATLELGQGRIRLAAGAWNFEFLPGADAFFPPGIALIGLDYSVLSNQSMIESPEQRRMLAEIGKNRPVIPVIWAHHDDGGYIGRSYKPFDQFQTRLVETNASGFGIIHWTTRPNDLYFVSHSRQVWQNTLNEPLRKTCDEMAARALGDVRLGEYLERWVTDAPIFGRETEVFFIDHPLLKIDEVIKGCRERLTLLGTVDNDLVNYYRGLEQFIADFFEVQDALQRAQAAFNNMDFAQARQIMEQCHPETVIAQFAKFSSIGGITRGEQGLIVSLNTRWLVYFVRMRQMLGMEPVRYHFGPTSHEELAELPGSFTYYFDDRHQVWQTLGTKETGAATFSAPSASNEIARQGLESDQPVTLKLRPIAQKADLPPGQYLLRLLFGDPNSIAEGQRVFTVSVDTTTSTVDVFKEARGAQKLVERVYPVTLTTPGEILVTLKPVKGKVAISGAVVEFIKP
jgi:hypothetical protein